MTRERFWMAVLALSAAITVAPVAWAAGDEGTYDPTAVPEVRCPVSGKPVEMAQSVETDDGKVYFCCDRCPAKYQTDPAKFAKRVAAQHEALAAHQSMVQVICPVSGKPVSKEFSAEHNGHNVLFCCGKCPEKFKSNPDSFKASLAKSFTRQAHCPISGEGIDPAAFVELDDGNKVYFCCNECAGKYSENPSKFGARLVGLRQCPMAECKDKGSYGGGKCPKCDMDRKVVGVDHSGHDHGAPGHGGEGHGGGGQGH